MPRQQFVRRSLELTPEQWAVLENLAAQSESLAPAGPNAGNPTWRSLIKRIANGEVLLIVYGSEPFTITEFNLVKEPA